MSSILPQIKALSQVPLIHQQYAEAALKLIIEKLLSMTAFDIGTFSEGEEDGSIVSFDGDDFENTNISLCYSYSKFILDIREHGDEFNMSIFKYKIFEGTPLYQMIPDKLIKAMEEVADNEEPIVFKPI